MVKCLFKSNQIGWLQNESRLNCFANYAKSMGVIFLKVYPLKCYIPTHGLQEKNTGSIHLPISFNYNTIIDIIVIITYQFPTPAISK